MKIFRTVVLALLAAISAVVIFQQYRTIAKLHHDNEMLRKTMEQFVARSDEHLQPAIVSSKPASASEAELRELLRLRGEVTVLRRQQDDLLKQLAVKTTPAQATNHATDEVWVQQLLNSGPREQGAVAGALRGKLLRRDMTNVSTSELALQDALLKLQLNQSLERSPSAFADFQAAFIQSALNISDPARVTQMRELIQRVYEQAVANGLDIPSKPTSAAEEWVDRRFTLDRWATAEMKKLLTPEESMLFDRAFLGVMGVDLGGVGVDKSNYPKGFLGE